jgi:hypothetical protein
LSHRIFRIEDVCEVRMIELPAAKVLSGNELQVTIEIPEFARSSWLSLAQSAKVQASRQMYVKLDKPRRPRTTGERSQNHHLNGHIQQIAEYTGDSFEAVKKHIKFEAIAEGYPYRTTSFGDVEPQSEADASTAECAILIETTHRIASDLEVILREYDDEEKTD